MAGAAPFRQYDNPPLHVLVADATGSASIIEVGESGNRVLDLAAHAGLQACEGETGPAACMAVLETAVNRSDAFPTRASMVFDPSAGRVYLAVAGDFESLWSLDLFVILLRILLFGRTAS